MIDFNYDYKTVYRLGTCHIESKKKATKPFFVNCEEKVDNTKKNIFLWGDSLAAHLYPGINEKYKRDFNIYQRTTGACKPYIITDTDKKNIKKNVEAIVLKKTFLFIRYLFLKGFSTEK